MGRKGHKALFTISPSPTIFWRFVLGTIPVLALLAVKDLIDRSNQLNVDISASRPWLTLLLLLILMALLALLGLAISFTNVRNRLWDGMEAPGLSKRFSRWIGIVLSATAVIGFSAVISIPYFRRILGGEYWVRFFIFWLFSLVGMWGIKIFRKETPWLIALLTIVLCQSTLHLLLVYLSPVTPYPFAMGWSETSRYYYPSLFLSEEVYGQQYSWPILHPTLHLLLAPPYLFDAPLWFHRLWQVVIRFVLVGSIVPALMARLSLKDRALRWLLGIWMFLFLFMGPIYFHLAVPVIILLLGFSPQDNRRTWVVVILASIWSGWSRINWYPVPGMIAAILYLMEVPFRGKTLWSYLFKPALWFVVGSLIAFGSQRIYILLSGIPDSDSFYTSLTSNLLWYRLLPNASYRLGILPAAFLASLPVWLAMFAVIRERRADWHPLRLILMFAALLILFGGGLVVSLKIGGGADLHNLDAYFILLLVISSYLAFARYRDENGDQPQPSSLHWAIALSIAITPVWMLLPGNIGLKSYDVSRTNAALENLQKYVDQVNASDGEMLFITQRHLISMNMLDQVRLVPEYEREELMEMAMANNREYLSVFRKDMQNQRFAVILVDPLNYRLLGKTYPFGEENNAWVSKIMKHILCNYREEIAFPADEIALYVPQEGTRQCP